VGLGSELIQVIESPSRWPSERVHDARHEVTEPALAGVPVEAGVPDHGASKSGMVKGSGLPGWLGDGRRHFIL